MSNLYQDAILDAKAHRASAMANAKAALEEAFEPKIQEMISKHLAEEEEKMEEDYGMEEEGAMHGDQEKMEEADINEQELEEILNQLEELEKPKDESLNEAEEEGEEEEEEETEEEEGGEEAAEETEEVSDETKVIDITLGDLKQVIQSLMPGQEMPAAEEPTADSEAEAEVSLEEILDELANEEAEQVSDVTHNGTGYEAGKQAHTKEEAMKTEALDPEGFDQLSDEQKKALAQQYMQARKAGKTDPKIDAAIDALAGKNLAESADMIALVGSSILGVLAATGLGITTWAALKGKLPKTPGKGQGGEFSWTREGKEEMNEAEGLDPEGFDQLSDEQKKALAQQYMDARKAGKTDPAIDKAIDALAGKNLAESADMIALIGSSILGVLAATGLGITSWAAIKGKLPKTPGPGQGSEYKWESKELKEAKATIQTLRKDLQEVNLLNAKYLYMNKLFKSKSLNESQKVKVINALDRATTVVEVKNIYETLKESFETKKQTIKESIGFASKPAGVAPKANIVEADQFVSRWQKLAGINK